MYGCRAVMYMVCGSPVSVNRQSPGNHGDSDSFLTSHPDRFDNGVGNRDDSDIKCANEGAECQHPLGLPMGYGPW